MHFFSMDNICAKVDKATLNPLKVLAFGMLFSGVSFIYIPLTPIVVSVSLGLFIGSLVNKYTIENVEENEK